MKFLMSIIVSFGAFLLIALSLVVQIEGMLGFVMAIPCLYFGVCFLIASSVVYQARAMSVKEMIYWGVLNIAYEFIGISFWIYKYEIKTFKINIKERN